MKNNRTKRINRLILFLTAAALVVTVSIAVTVAYLSAVTDPKVNTFTPATDVRGETIEPYGEAEGTLSGNSTVIYSYKPGEQYAKDPLIHSLTTDSEVYVGARVDFYIAIKKSGGSPVYWQVPYGLFTKYVAINGSNVVSENTTTGNWEAKAVATAKNDNDNAVPSTSQFYSYVGSEWSKYYVYNYVLEKASSSSESVAIGTNSGFYKIGTTNEDKEGSTSSDKTSITAPIFTSVTPSGKITVSNNSTSYTTVLYADGPQLGDVYELFDFKIVVNGYGVAADSTDSRDEVITHLKEDLTLPDAEERIDVTTASVTNTQLKASHS